MRKNKVSRESLGLLKTTYLIKGLNLDRFINTAKKRGIALYELKKYANNRLLVTVNFEESGKFFAIAKELCYNIKKVRDKGRAYPLLALYRSLGVVIGCLIISLSVICVNDYIFSFSFTGSGSVYKREVERYLGTCGIKEYSRFSDIDFDLLEDGILAQNPHLSFASCKKVGNRLVIDLALSTKKVETLKGDVYALYSDTDGVIEDIKVYRGTAVVSAGQSVRVGDLLVDGVAVIKEQTVKINLLASVTINCEGEYQYRSKIEGEEEKAVMFAEQYFDDREVLSSSVRVENIDGEYVYNVTVRYRRVICAG